MGPRDSGLFLFAMIGGGMLIGLVALVGGLLHAHRARSLSHAERMKALEMGREVPDDATTARVKALAGPGDDRSPAGRCFAATGHACFWGFLFAIGASSKDVGGSQGAAYAIASAAGAVGVTGLICGTVLSSRQPGTADRPGKARYDPDGP